MVSLSRKQKLVLLLLLSLLLCSLGFYNGFPFVFSDTGTYIWSGFTNEVPMDRPIMYGLFLRHVSLAESLWLVIFVQAFILALCFYYIFRYFCVSKNYFNYLIAYIVTITLFTGASVNTSQLMPDIFAPILILCIMLLFFADLVLRDRIIIIGLALFSLMVHNSHFGTFGLFLFAISLGYLLKRIRKKSFFIRGKRIITGWILLISSWLLLSTVHYSLGSKFAISQISHIFLMSRMHETGILVEFLKKECEHKNYAICEYKDKIPWDFIWDPQSPTQKLGGWMACKDEYNQILKDIIFSPRYGKHFAMKSFTAGVKQFFRFDAGDTPPLVMDSSPYNSISWFYPYYKMEYLGSLQANNKLDFTFINFSQRILVLISLLFGFLMLLSKETPKYIKHFVASLFLLLILNAFVCGALSSISPRYQARVIWLIILPIFIFISDSGGISQTLKLFSKKSSGNVE